MSEPRHAQTMTLRLTIVALALATTAHAARLDLPWTVSARKPNAIAVEGTRAYLATGDNRAELVVVDVETGATLGTFDAVGGADALSVKLLGPGVVKLGRRMSDAPEVYHLDVSDPTAIKVLSTGERNKHVKWKPTPPPPVRFADVNGDGVFRLGCLGDSNTIGHAWCEMLRDLIADPRFDVVNVAVSGATVGPNVMWSSDAAEQLARVLPSGPDALVLAFGTNDRFHGRSAHDVVAAYVERVNDAAALGLPAYVATTPPMACFAATPCTKIEESNALLRATFAGDGVIEFFDGFGGEHFKDNIHLNHEGQAMRAERAAAVIASPLRAVGR